MGETLAAAKNRLAGQPLTAAIVYKPAKPGQRLGVVLDQFPSRGTLSAYDKVTIVLPKSLHGALPRVVGLSLARAQAKLARFHLDVHVTGGSSGKVVGQAPRSGAAVEPGMRVTLALG